MAHKSKTMRQISLWLEQADLDALDDLKWSRRLNRSECLREMIRKGAKSNTGRVVKQSTA